MLETKLDNPPSDCISCVIFTRNASNLLLATSWDCTARIYNPAQNILISQYQHSAPILSGSFINSGAGCVTGGVDCQVKTFEINTQKEVILGTHDKPIRCISYGERNGLIYSGSWDKTVKVWDLRSPNKCIATIKQPGKVYAMDLTPNETALVVGTHGRFVFVYDTRTNSILQRRESSLNYQTRCLKCFPDNTGFAISSIEGRVGIEYFDKSPEVQAKKYAFKCHRSKTSTGEILYPVNAISFHPKYGTFATGGCDGRVNTWDGQNKKRLCQFPKYPTSISSLDFNYDGSLLAIASSYTFEMGELEHYPKDEIFIHTVMDNEV